MDSPQKWGRWGTSARTIHIYFQTLLWICIYFVEPDQHQSHKQVAVRLTVESLRLTLETWRFCRLVVADSHHVDEEPDPLQIKMSVLDPHQSDLSDPVLDQSDADPQHCFQITLPGSVTSRVADPDSHGSALIDCGSGSRRAKMTHKSRKKYRILMFWSAGCSLLRAEGFFCTLAVLYGGLGISKLQYLIKKKIIKISICKFFSI